MSEKKYIIKPKGTLQSKLLMFDAFWRGCLVKAVSILILVFGVLSILILANNLTGALPQYKLNNGVVIFIIALGFMELPLFLFHKDLANIQSLKNDSADNLFNRFDLDLAKATSGIYSKEASTKDLILSLSKTHDANFIFFRLGIGEKNLEEIITHYTGNYSPQDIAIKAFETATEKGRSQIQVGDFIESIFKTDAFFQEILNIYKLNISDIQRVVDWLNRMKEEIKTKNVLLSANNFIFTGGIGRDWAYGYTLFLKHFSYDIINIIKDNGLNLEIVGHEREIGAIKESLLSNSGNNVLVVGEPGVGKRTAVLGFAKQVTEGRTNSPLDHRHILQIDIDSLLAGVSSPGEITERVMSVFSEASSAGNVIIYIENFQNMLSSGDAGRSDLSQILLQVLESPSISIIGTCDVASYHQYIVPNTAFNQRITRVDIAEPTESEMLEILENVVYQIEYRTKCMIPYATIKQTYTLGEKYLLNMPNPEKSINLLDRAAAFTSSKRGQTIIGAEDIADYVSEKFNVPAGDAETGERQKLLSLEAEMHKDVIGQDQAISAVANALRRARAGVVNSKKPIGSFLFLGPTGVGKTETAKSLARSYFGGADRMIRFDMSEYQNRDDIYRFIGSNIRGENIPGALTTAIRENPFSLLLFDEIEKACPEILDLFLQMLDEGVITDGTGRKVSFSNCIIIATSNAGSDLIRNAITSGQDYNTVKKDLISYLQDKGIYRPEFLNRFSTVAVFSPLSENQIQQVAGFMFEDLKADIFANKGISIDVAPEVLAILAKMGFDPQMGARPMARVIQEKIEDMLAQKILAGELNRGDSFAITPSEIQP